MREPFIYRFKQKTKNTKLRAKTNTKLPDKPEGYFEPLPVSETQSEWDEKMDRAALWAMENKQRTVVFSMIDIDGNSAILFPEYFQFIKLL